MKVALYSRVSTQEQAINGYSIDEQQERMNKYCEAMGWQAYKEYTDAGYSGATTARPALQKMIKDVEAGKVDKVLVYKLDRLSRSQLDTLYLIEKIFLANNVDFISMSENFDTATPFGRAMIGILAVFAQLEREQIKERMMMGKEARAKKGLYHGSNSYPIGYDYVDGQLIPLDFEAMQIRIIFEKYANGDSPMTIAEYLNGNGYTTRYGRWNDTTIRKILKRKTYIGYVKYHDEWFEGQHEAIISRELFDEVQEIYNKKSRDYKYNKRRDGSVNSYLGGLLHCKYCGRKYLKVLGTSTKNGVKYKIAYYKCYSRAHRKRLLKEDPHCKNKTWRMDELDNLILGEIRKLVLDPESFDDEEEQSSNQNVEILKNEIVKIEKQIDKLMDLYSIGGMSIEAVQDKIHALDNQKKKLELQLESFEKETKMSKGDAKKIITSFGDLIDEGDFEDIRWLITTLIEKIVIDGEDLEIYWKF